MSNSPTARWGAFLSANDGRPPRAVILGCSGLTLTDEERRFFAEADPFGFILFARNVATPDQVRALTAALRESVGRADAPVLIDQEGGRVRRLHPPAWRSSPPMRPFGELYDRDPGAARRALALNIGLLSAELLAVGIDVDCAPVLDVPVEGAHDIIGDRAFSDDPRVVADLGRVAHDAFLEAGVFPVVKHIPGHGRATADSHLALPRVRASRRELEERDFLPFRALRDAPFGMTAHIVYTAFDAERPATTSPTVIKDVIRGELGFGGLLMTDDLSMKALEGPFDARARDALDAGCDLVLHCNGDLEEMRAVVHGSRVLTDAARERWERACARRTAATVGGKAEDTVTAEAELARLLN